MNKIRQGLKLNALSFILLIYGGMNLTHVNAAVQPQSQNTLNVEVEDIMEHLMALQTIANNNGGKRSVRTNGDKQTRDYIARKLTNAGLNVQRIPVVFEDFHELSDAVLEQISPNPKTYIEGDPGAPDAQMRITINSGNGDVTAAVQAVDVQIPPGAEPNSSTSGCEKEDFSGFLPGNIALIQRGGCLFPPKVINAQKAGAAGVILFNEGTPGNDLRNNLIGTILQNFPGVDGRAEIPVVFTEFAVGEELYNTGKNSEVTVHLKTNAEFLHTETENIIAETPFGRPDHVIMTGAHLDSVEAGPGINDNGSGVATVLEIAKRVNKLKSKTLNKLRFAFWGAEETGLVGSTQYVDNLSDAEIANIAFYLNADMLGSPNFVPSVYDVDFSDLAPLIPIPPGALGSEAVEQALVDYFKNISAFKAAPTLLAVDGRSDYNEFAFFGIPYGAITSGFDNNKTLDESVIFGGTAGAPYDACYHKACDTISNVSKASLRLMSGALAHTLMEFANREIIFP